MGLFFLGGKGVAFLTGSNDTFKAGKCQILVYFLSCFYFWNCSFCLLFIHMSMWETPCLNVPVPTQLTV